MRPLVVLLARPRPRSPHLPRYALFVGPNDGPLLANAHTSITPIVEKRGGVLRVVESQ